MFTQDDFDKIDEEELPQAIRLAEYIIRKYNPDSVCDVGCASGVYLTPFLSKVESVWGYDVVENPKNSYVESRDFAEPFDPPPADLVLCLEVLEHIPEWDADKFLDNLVKVSDLVFFSAAIPGQGGKGHINCQPKSYWASRMARRGLYVDVDETKEAVDFMRSGYHMGWLTQNLTIFRKAE